MLERPSERTKKSMPSNSIIASAVVKPSNAGGRLTREVEMDATVATAKSTGARGVTCSLCQHLRHSSTCAALHRNRAHHLSSDLATACVPKDPQACSPCCALAFGPLTGCITRSLLAIARRSTSQALLCCDVRLMVVCFQNIPGHKAADRHHHTKLLGML